MEFDAGSIEQFRTRLRHKVAHHLGGFCPDVNDVVQETLTRFLDALRDGRIRNPDSLGAFLSGICNNVIREYRRRLWREPPPVLDPPEARTEPETDMLEAREAIAAVLAELSDRDSRLLRAFYLQEMDREEICRQEGLSAGHLRVALFRAKDRFRKIYRQQLKRTAGGNH